MIKFTVPGVFENPSLYEQIYLKAVQEPATHIYETNSKVSFRAALFNFLIDTSKIMRDARKAMKEKYPLVYGN
jgi:hypothetical protein